MWCHSSLTGTQHSQVQPTAPTHRTAQGTPEPAISTDTASPQHCPRDPRACHLHSHSQAQPTAPTALPEGLQSLPSPQTQPDTAHSTHSTARGTPEPFFSTVSKHQARLQASTHVLPQHPPSMHNRMAPRHNLLPSAVKCL